MDIIFSIHNIFGERILPVLIIGVAIWLTIAWKPGVGPHRAARLFPILVDIQATLGLIYFAFMLGSGAGAYYLTFPFILHPVLGLISAGVGHMAISPTGPFSRLGRWGVLAGLVLLLATVLIGVVIARRYP